MTGPDLDAIRQRQYAVRAAERIRDRAEDHPAARLGLFDAAMDSAGDVPALLAEVERLRAEGAPGVMHAVDKSFHDLAIKERDYERVRVERLRAEVERQADTIRRILAVRNTAIQQLLDAADVIRDLLRLSDIPGDPPDEAIVRERAETLLAKVPPRPVLATDNDLTEVE